MSIRTDYTGERGPTAPGQVTGVFVALERALTDELLPRIEGWFEERDEVAVIDLGTTDKQDHAFILLEWYDYEVDILFLTILEQEDAVIDYTVYGREA